MISILVTIALLIVPGRADCDAKNGKNCHECSGEDLKQCECNSTLLCTSCPNTLEKHEKKYKWDKYKCVQTKNDIQECNSFADCTKCFDPHEAKKWNVEQCMTIKVCKTGETCEMCEQAQALVMQKNISVPSVKDCKADQCQKGNKCWLHCAQGSDEMRQCRKAEKCKKGNDCALNCAQGSKQMNVCLCNSLLGCWKCPDNLNGKETGYNWDKQTCKLESCHSGKNCSECPSELTSHTELFEWGGDACIICTNPATKSDCGRYCIERHLGTCEAKFDKKSEAKFDKKRR